MAWWHGIDFAFSFPDQGYQRMVSTSTCISVMATWHRHRRASLSWHGYWFDQKCVFCHSAGRNVEHFKACWWQFLLDTGDIQAWASHHWWWMQLICTDFSSCYCSCVVLRPNLTYQVYTSWNIYFTVTKVCKIYLLFTCSLSCQRLEDSVFFSCPCFCEWSVTFWNWSEWLLISIWNKRHKI